MNAFSESDTEDTEVALRAPRRFCTADVKVRCECALGDGFESSLGVSQLFVSAPCALCNGLGMTRSSVRIGLSRAAAPQKS